LSSYLIRLIRTVLLTATWRRTVTRTAGRIVTVRLVTTRFMGRASFPLRVAFLANLPQLSDANPGAHPGAGHNKNAAPSEAALTYRAIRCYGLRSYTVDRAQFAQRSPCQPRRGFLVSGPSISDSTPV
jgi:hypothetical protein